MVAFLGVRLRISPQRLDEVGAGEPDLLVDLVGDHVVPVGEAVVQLLRASAAGLGLRLPLRERRLVRLARGLLRRLDRFLICLLYTSPSPRDGLLSRMPSSA